MFLQSEVIILIEVSRTTQSYTNSSPHWNMLHRHRTLCQRSGEIAFTKLSSEDGNSQCTFNCAGKKLLVA